MGVHVWRALDGSAPPTSSSCHKISTGIDNTSYYCTNDIDVSPNASCQFCAPGGIFLYHIMSLRKKSYVSAINVRSLNEDWGLIVGIITKWLYPLMPPILGKFNPGGLYQNQLLLAAGMVLLAWLHNLSIHSPAPRVCYSIPHSFAGLLSAHGPKM